jgi:hypothetical protein
MSPAAVTDRLREMVRLFAQRGFVGRGVDMSSAAVTSRLRTVASLSDLCRRLAPIGQRLASKGIR